MPANESSLLLPPTGQNGQRAAKKFDPIGSSRHLIFGSWLNILLVTIPLCFIGERYAACVELMRSRGAPLARGGSFRDLFPRDRSLGQGESSRQVRADEELLGDSTEQLSMRLGQTLGGLLNAT